MTPLDLTIPFMLGLVGSLHCVQMCGPIVLSYSLLLGSQPKARYALAHASYNAGRIFTYALLGAVAGSAGGAVGFLGRIAGMKNAAAVAAGCLLIVAGLWIAGLFRGSSLVGLSGAAPKPLARLLRSPSPAAKLGLGLALGFLPCGLVYAALLKAVETAHPLWGALTMLAFGAGTSGALLAMGAFSSTAGKWLGRYSNRLAAAGVIFMGVFLLWRGLLPPTAHHH
ncbi:MAG: sulfite exporter TauE/SafE family protein [Bryobacteraceae bacterium]|nr:sulfite exporter TauE/SafE family protein [Bryobacteraceae bacterium]